MVVFFISFSTHKQENKIRSEISLHNAAQLVARPQSTSSLPVTLHNHSSTGYHTTVYFKLAQLSLRKGHNYTDSQAHSQAGSQACQCLGWQKRGVSKIGEASPSSSGTNQNKFYPGLIVFSLFYHTMTPTNANTLRNNFTSCTFMTLLNQQLNYLAPVFS